MSDSVATVIQDDASTPASVWKISVEASRDKIETALLAHEDALDWPDDMIIGGRELDEKRPNDWVLEIWCGRKPSKADRAHIVTLFGGAAPTFKVEKLANKDWVKLSQQGVKPIIAGRFYVHTPDYPPSSDSSLNDFCIPASQAFGTGQHDTTAGCLDMLSLMKRRGIVVRNLIDIGTGTGLLAFAAMRLWPGAYATASDIDEVCAKVVAENAAINSIPMGGQRGTLAMDIADGMDSALLEARAPFDLLIANILAGPLQDLAEDFAAHVSPGGQLLLAGLLQTQEGAVLRSYRHAGFRLVARLGKGDWSVLWMRKRRYSRHSF